MGKMNLLKSCWDGRVGETVGAKWKNKKTIRTYTKPSNPKTADQQKVRGVFGSMTTYVARFADGIKYMTALPVAGMSVRNAIIKLNKDQIDAGTFDKTVLAISKGGLQKPAGVALAITANKAVVTWTSPTATNFTANAKMIAVVVDETNEVVDVIQAAANAETATGTVSFTASTGVDVYCYYLDSRGSNKVASNSVYASI